MRLCREGGHFGRKQRETDLDCAPREGFSSPLGPGCCPEDAGVGTCPAKDQLSWIQVERGPELHLTHPIHPSILAFLCLSLDSPASPSLSPIPAPSPSPSPVPKGLRTPSQRSLPAPSRKPRSRRRESRILRAYRRGEAGSVGRVCAKAAGL